MSATGRFGKRFFRWGVVFIGVLVVAAIIAWPYVWQAWAEEQNERLRPIERQAYNQYLNTLLTHLPQPADDSDLKVRFTGHSQVSFKNPRQSRHSYNNITYRITIQLENAEPAPAEHGSEPLQFVIQCPLTFDEKSHKWEHSLPIITDEYYNALPLDVNSLPSESLKSYFRAFEKNYPAATLHAMASDPLPPPVLLYNEDAHRGWQRLWYPLWDEIERFIEGVQQSWQHL